MFLIRFKPPVHVWPLGIATIRILKWIKDFTVDEDISLLARLPRPHVSWQMRADNRFVTAKDIHQDCFRLLIVIIITARAIVFLMKIRVVSFPIWSQLKWRIASQIWAFLLFFLRLVQSYLNRMKHKFGKKEASGFKPMLRQRFLTKHTFFKMPQRLCVWCYTCSLIRSLFL